MEEYNMKKIAILVATVLVLGGINTRTYAAEVNTQTTQATDTIVTYKDEAGITPDSLLYTIDQAVDNLRIVLASSTEKEATVITSIAEERLGESEVMAEKGEAELAEEALKEYSEKITEAIDKLQEVVNNTEVVAPETAEGSTNEKLEQSITDLEKAIQEVQEKSLVVLDNLKEVITEESVEDVKEVIEDQTTHKEAVAKFVAERHDFNAAKKDLNMANVELKKVKKSGSEADIKATQDKLTAAQSAYMLAKTDLNAAFEAKKVADAKIEENKEEVSSEEVVAVPTEEATTVEGATPVEENNKVVEDAAKPAGYTKTNNGNGHENKPSIIEKKDSEGKKDEKVKIDKETSEQGKSEEAKGKKK
jgi:uncharacterized protein YeeX (DUF496 family)